MTESLPPVQRWEKFGELTVIVPRIEVKNPRRKRHRFRVLVSCRCKRLKLVFPTELRAGERQKCIHCIKEEAATRERRPSVQDRLGHIPYVTAEDAYSEYLSFIGMKMRCCHKNHAAYPNYGGRGITVDPSWLEQNVGFSRFLHAMGRKPGPEWTLERIDVEGNYVSSNCKWIKREAQAWNKRTTRYVEYQGKTWCLGQLAGLLGLEHSTLYNRVFVSKWPEHRWNEAPRGQN